MQLFIGLSEFDDITKMLKENHLRKVPSKAENAENWKDLIIWMIIYEWL